MHLKSITKANFVFHIASVDEYRENFDLTNIESAGVRGIEFVLPGVHSDIGGSYLDSIDEISVIDNHQSDDSDSGRNASKVWKEKRYDEFKKIVVEEGWFTDKQLQKEFFHEEDFDPLTRWYENQYNYGLVGRRPLKNSYDKIPLHLMVNQSKKFKVIYNENKLKTLTINDPFIERVKNSLGHYINACVDKHNEYVNIYNNVMQNFEDLSNGYNDELKKIHYQDFIPVEDLKELRNKFLHWSAKDNLLGLSPTKGGPVVQDKRKRGIYNG